MSQVQAVHAHAVASGADGKLSADGARAAVAAIADGTAAAADNDDGTAGNGRAGPAAGRATPDGRTAAANGTIADDGGPADDEQMMPQQQHAMGPPTFH